MEKEKRKVYIVVLHQDYANHYDVKTVWSTLELAKAQKNIQMYPTEYDIYEAEVDSGIVADIV